MEERPQTAIKPSRLSSASDVIDALGGTNAVAELLNIGASSVSNYRKQGFPARSHFILAKICKERGLDVADAVFGGYQVKSKKAPYQAAPLQRADTLTSLKEAGFTPVSLPILQPAAPFIDRMGPEMQRRLFTFTDPGGEQLCLRPDLTIPTALAHIASGQSGEARYCYQGTAFRYQPRGSGQPEEFTQLGLEIIGGASAGEDGLADDLDVLSTITDRLKEVGIKEFDIKFTDATLLNFFIDNYGLSEPARRQIKRALKEMKSADDFKTLALSRSTREIKSKSLPDDSVIIAGRTGQEIRDRAEQLLNQFIENDRYDEVVTKIYGFIRSIGGGDISPNEIRLRFQDITEQQASRVDSLDEEIFKPFLTRYAPSRLQYTPMFSTGMAYYTGLSFEIYASGLDRPIAAGGRYDDLLHSLGAAEPLSAVGGAIALERLNRAVDMQS